MKILILSIALVLTFYLPQKATAQVYVQDSLALIALYNSTDGANWNNPWNISQPVSTWLGVTIDSVGRVSMLFFHTVNMNGYLPSEIGNLTELTDLKIWSSPNLMGNIPHDIGNLTKLQHLDISNTSLTSPIPPEIGNLTNLKYLKMNSNLFSGVVPDEICNLTNLENINFQSNNFNGSLPDSIGKLTNLRFLDLYGNNINRVPPSASSLINLENINLMLNEELDSLPYDMFLNNVHSDLWIQLHGCNFNSLPDLSNTDIDLLYIGDNRLTFESIEPFIDSVYYYGYWPQDSVLEAIDTTIHVGDTLVLSSLVGGQNNIYRWKKNSVTYSYGPNPYYIIYNASTTHTGTYYCEITNTLATDLTLYRRPVRVTVDTSTSNVLNKATEKIYCTYNPVNNTVYFNNLNRINEINISDLQGRSVYKYKGNSLPEYLSLQQGGAYIVKIVTVDGVFTKKVF